MKRLLVVGETTEESARLAKIAPDDKAFASERRRRRKKPPASPPMPETGPCCGRCAHWNAPGPDDDFGECRQLAAVMVPRRAERNHVEAMEKAILMSRSEDVMIEALRTKSWFACSRFEEAA